jgi:hypothetical protein
LGLCPLLVEVFPVREMVLMSRPVDYFAVDVGGEVGGCEVDLLGPLQQNAILAPVIVQNVLLCVSKSGQYLMKKLPRIESW